MLPNEKNDKLDAKNTKCLLFGYCKGTRAYRLICWKTNKIMKSRDVLFMDDRTSVGNYLKMDPNERNDALMVVRMHEFVESPFINLGEDIEECEEQVGDNQAAI